MQRPHGGWHKVNPASTFQSAAAVHLRKRTNAVCVIVSQRGLRPCVSQSPFSLIASSRAAQVTCVTEGGSGFFDSIVFHFHERVPRGRKAPA